VFFETDNGEIEIYGLENGLYATALTGNTGEQMQDDTAFTFTLSGLQTSLPKYFLYGGSLATSIAYLDNIGIEPIYKVESYTAGTSTIDFTNNGGDDWSSQHKQLTTQSTLLEMVREYILLNKHTMFTTTETMYLLLQCNHCTR
jgi:hypothetical protein